MTLGRSSIHGTPRSTRHEDGSVDARVAPLALPAHHPLAGISGPLNAVAFHTDLLGTVTVSGPGAGRIETAYALLVGHHRHPPAPPRGRRNRPHAPRSSGDPPCLTPSWPPDSSRAKGRLNESAGSLRSCSIAGQILPANPTTCTAAVQASLDHLLNVCSIAGQRPI
ncbi:hypothetical protein [Streptomyces chattanoogensis]|uniref:hypothetical protein n=1 Tax=Streptomyces chattanoogensis TaxID=66876 RepID=UPI00367C93EE